MKRWIVIGCLLLVGFGSGVGTVEGQTFSTDSLSGAQFTEYELQLNAILRTSRTEERDFISQIVSQVQAGNLPSRLVATSFHWVKTKRPETNYPFIYFERVLRLQAAKINLADQIPPFDFSIYGSAGQRTEGQNPSVGQADREQRNLFSLFRFNR